MTKIIIPPTNGKYIFEQNIISMISKYKHEFSNDKESNLIITVYSDIELYKNSGIEKGLADINTNNFASEKEVSSVFTKWKTYCSQ